MSTRISQQELEWYPKRDTRWRCSA